MIAKKAEELIFAPFEPQIATDLLNFRHNGKWDAQRVDGKFVSPYRDVATINIGVYGAAAGIPQSMMLSIENAYAARYSHFGVNEKMDSVYTSLPVINVFNTMTGYGLVTDRKLK